MFLCAAHALAISRGKSITINGSVNGFGNDENVVAYVNKFALCRCFVCAETDSNISVVLYEDEWE